MPRSPTRRNTRKRRTYLWWACEGGVGLRRVVAGDSERFENAHEGDRYRLAVDVESQVWQTHRALCSRCTTPSVVGSVTQLMQLWGGEVEARGGSTLCVLPPPRQCSALPQSDPTETPGPQILHTYRIRHVDTWMLYAPTRACMQLLCARVRTCAHAQPQPHSPRLNSLSASLRPDPGLRMGHLSRS